MALLLHRLPYQSPSVETLQILLGHIIRVEPRQDLRAHLLLHGSPLWIPNQILPFPWIVPHVEQLRVVSVDMVVLVLPLSGHDARHADRFVRLSEDGAIRSFPIDNRQETVPVVR